MFLGPLGDFTRRLAPHIPQDPVAVHVQALGLIGAYLGYTPYLAEGATRRRPNLFMAVIGGTGTGKGTTLGYAQWLMESVDPDFLAERATTQIGSVEGLLAKITDPVYVTNKDGEEMLSVQARTTSASSTSRRSSAACSERWSRWSRSRRPSPRPTTRA